MGCARALRRVELGLRRTWAATNLDCDAVERTHPIFVHCPHFTHLRLREAAPSSVQSKLADTSDHTARAS